MAKMYQNGKWKKKTLVALSLALTATLSLGVFSACTAAGNDNKDDSPPKVAPTDTQILKNGNFEFYSDKLVDPDDNGKPLDKKNIISSSVDNWTFTAGSPSSDTKSGIIDTADWDYFTKTGGYPFHTVTKGEGDDEKEAETFESIGEAYAHWKDENVSAYDRLKFLDFYKDDISDLDSGSDEKKLFNEYSYAVDFEDVEKINEEAGTDGKFKLHDGATEEDENNTSVLMIHNSRESDGVRGTAQYFTSASLTLTPGAAAKVSVWVRTESLYHWGVDLTQSGGAYIGVTNTVGGTTLDQMQIYNIHTQPGEWQQYTVYVRASTFATTTFRIVLGLGQGSSDDKYYMVDGYAFFDDVECELMNGEEYEKAIHKEESGEPKENVLECTIDSLKEARQFDYDKHSEIKTYGLDLYAPNDDSIVSEMLDPKQEDIFSLTSEVSGSKTYTSYDKGFGENGNDVTEILSLSYLKENTSENSYLKQVYDADFAGDRPFPFDENEPIVMLLSAGGAAYTAKLGEISLQEDERMLISFFVKSSKIPSGLSGAGALVVDGENKTYISAFDTTTLADVDIDSSKDADESLKDIYKGWTQCFFFLENTSTEEKTFHIELTYGPTSIVNTDRFSYGDGYAAFTHFETKSLSKTEYGYATTGDRAKKVSLTGGIEEAKKFDSVAATSEKDLETKPANPTNYLGVLGGSDYVQNNPDDAKVPNEKPNGVTSGLLNAKYADNYVKQDASWKTVLGKFASDSNGDGSTWWNSLFGNARQPLVIINEEDAAWGYFAETATFSASSYRRISMRVKVSEGAKAYIYLTDTEAEQPGTMLSANLPGYTYWYDDDGNICGSDPTADDYDKKDPTKGILYERRSNGLYTKKGGSDNEYFANLRNFEKDDDENYVTGDGTIVFYYNAQDKKYYSYRSGDEGNYSYDLVVNNLPDDVPLRYTGYTDPDTTADKTKAQIVVDGTDGEWETVNFYVHTGNAEKTYRLEVWSGSRDGKEKNPEGSFVAFDNFSSEDVSSDFATHRDDIVKQIKDDYNKDKTPSDEGYLGDDDNLPEDYALYYTFTFFDSDSYVRYDETLDTEGLGNPYHSYKQSEKKELLVWLSYRDEAGNGFYFLDFDATDVTVERDYPSQDEPSDDNPADESTGNNINIWLLISSGSLAIVLVLVILILIIRRIMKKFGKHAKVKVQKDKRYRPNKGSSAPVEEPSAEEPSAETPDENREE